MRRNALGEILRIVSKLTEAHSALEAEWEALEWASDLARRENWNCIIWSSDARIVVDELAEGFEPSGYGMLGPLTC